MKKAEYQKYLQSGYWQNRRKEAIADVQQTCEKCCIPRWLAQLVFQQDLNVHHLNYQNLGCEEFTDLEVLCRRCHEIETFGRSDLRAPKTAVCILCENVHWNVYSDLCNECKFFESLSHMKAGDALTCLSIRLNKLFNLQHGDDDCPF